MAIKAFPETVSEPNTGEPIACFHISLPYFFIHSVDSYVWNSYINRTLCQEGAGFDCSRRFTWEEVNTKASLVANFHFHTSVSLSKTFKPSLVEPKMISLSVSKGVEVTSKLKGNSLRTITRPVLAFGIKNDSLEIIYNRSPRTEAWAPRLRKPFVFASHCSFPIFRSFP